MSKEVFNIIVFTGNNEIGSNGFVKYRKINNLNRFISFVSNKYPLWKFATVYDCETNEKKIITPNKK